MAIEKITAKSGSVKWKVDIWSKGKKVKTATFTQKKDADDWERQEQIALEQEQYFPDRLKSIPFKELYSEWLTNHCDRHLAPNTIVKNKQMYKQYLACFFAEKQVAEIRPTDIDVFVNWMQKENSELKNVSINRVLEVLRASLNYAMRRRYLLHTPMMGFRLLPVQEQAFDILSFEEASLLLSYANQKYQGNERWSYVFYLTLLKTGVRLGEAIGIKWQSILFDRNLIRIEATFDKTLKTVKSTTKSKKIRYVPLDEDLKSELLGLKARSKGLFVFTNRADGTVDPDNFRSRCFLHDLKETGIRHVRIHDLRHTFASHFVMNGGSLYDLQVILGHADNKMVMRYAHLAPEYIAQKASIVRFDTQGFQNVSGHHLDHRSGYNSGEGKRVINATFGVPRRNSSPQIHPKTEKDQKKRPSSFSAKPL